MRKIAITLLLGCSLSFSADCEKMQIDELKYMKKNELIEAYKNQHAHYNLNSKFIEQWVTRAKEYESKGEINNAIINMAEAQKLSKINTCYSGNEDNIKRVLEKDFKVNEKELNKLINSK